MIDPEEHAKARNGAFANLPLAGPLTVAVDWPKDEIEANRIRPGVLVGMSIQQFTQHYVPYSARAHLAGTASRPVQELRNLHADHAKRLVEHIAEKGMDVNRVGWLPVKARDQDFIALVERGSGNFLGVLDIPPSESASSATTR